MKSDRPQVPTDWKRVAKGVSGVRLVGADWRCAPEKINGGAKIGFRLDALGYQRAVQGDLQPGADVRLRSLKRAFAREIFRRKRRK